MEKGLIDLRSYLSSNSYERIKMKFFLYETLSTYNFKDFKSMQLNTTYGSKSYYDKIELLVDQGYLKLHDIVKIHNIPISNANQNSYDQIIELINIQYDRYTELQKQSPFGVNNFDANKAQFQLIALQERLLALLHKEKLDETLIPVTSLISYNSIDLIFPKANVYRVLINNFPVPADIVPFNDVIQYRNEESNRLNFLRLRSWAKNISERNLSEKEIAEEIETLIAENKREMELAGMKYQNAKLEFLFKLIPSSIEKIVKLSLSEICDPFFKLRNEKITLLETENKAKGSELAYIINA